MLGRFQTTIWTSIRLARDGKSTAVNSFVAKYRDPVLSFLRRQGFSEDDAEDLCQEVFLLIVKDDLLSRAEESRGRFRSFLLGVARNVARNAERVRAASKRGEGSIPETLGADVVASGPPDETFDRDWIRHMLSLALDALAREHPKSHQALGMVIDRRLPYAEIARTLGMEAKQVDNLIQQARARLGGLLRAEVAAYCGSREEYDDEIACLKRHLAPMAARVERT